MGGGRIEVAAGVIWRDGLFLAVKRPEGKPFAGYWEFPGGKVEPGESVEQALERELMEELGLRPLQAEFWRRIEHDYKQVRVGLSFFHVFRFAGRPRPNEGGKIEWLTPQSARAKMFLQADREIVERLGRENPTPDPRAGE